MIESSVYAEKAFFNLAYSLRYPNVGNPSIMDEIKVEVGKFAAVCHGIAVTSGWWRDPRTGAAVKRNPYELHALFHSEASEAMEAYRRKNRKDDRLPERFGLEVELADLSIRIGDYVGSLGLASEFGGLVAVTAMAFDDLREFMQTENVAERLDCIHVEIAFSSFFHRKEGPLLSLPHLARAFCLAVTVADLSGLDLYAAAVEKCRINMVREDHKLETRRDAADGKNF